MRPILKLVKKPLQSFPRTQHVLDSGTRPATEAKPEPLPPPTDGDKIEPTRTHTRIPT